MRLGSIILSWATAAISWPGLSSGSATAARAPRSRDYELSTEFFLVPSEIGQHGLASVASVISVPAPNRTVTVFRSPPPGVRKGQEVEMRPTPKSLLKQRPWALPLAALSAAAMLLMASFEVFVLFKARTTAPNRRHLFLGQALLLGLFLLAGLSAAASLSQNPLSCAAFRLVGLPAALVFAALLVKCVFLLSLNSGVYLPAPYQGGRLRESCRKEVIVHTKKLFLVSVLLLQALVLVFAVLVQVAIVGQWFYGEPPAVIQVQQQAGAAGQSSSTSTSCKTPLGQIVASLGYPGALLVAVACLAVRARGVRDNNREAAFIGLAVGLSLPIWVSSGIGSLAAGSEDDREAWLAYGLLATSLFVFLTMFLPKGRQLAALGREGPAAVIRDRDDALSSLPGSGYSPSFFHFKPAEASLKRKMHYHSADRVALVSSGIPGCSACRHGGSPIYSDDVHGPMETFVLPPGMYLRPEDAGNLYTTLSANPNVFFQRAAHPGMMY
ncbi:metabotropic glutamate receptor [Lasius niger]|uniref:Metabotropic glutamate receptor n=1 Tax=Lasius niger TaxID=67767 RepID=A0A0J7KWT8_LASNI|nr:metabotropic glutamate receptor [Lasius niger]